MLSIEHKNAFYEYAKQVSPAEACGVLILEHDQKTLIFCKNISHEPNNQFTICPMDYANAEDRGEILAIIHSHPKTSPEPSQTDLISCEQTGVPWWILGVLTGEWNRIEPTGYRAPLLGRQYSYGVLDCWELVRDYYHLILNIELPRVQSEFEWWSRGENLFVENAERCNFIEVDPKHIKKHDLVLFQIRSSIPNHIGVYLGDEMFLHQLNKHLSTREILGGFWAKNMMKVYRYRGELNETGQVVR